MLPIRIVLQSSAVFLLLCLNQVVSGGCLSYGHSCWGAHGKRNGGERQSDEYMTPSGRPSQWFLTRLLKARRDDPMDSRNIFGPENVITGSERGVDTELLMPDGDNRKSRLSADPSIDDAFSDGDRNDLGKEVVIFSPEELATTKLQ